MQRIHCGAAERMGGGLRRRTPVRGRLAIALGVSALLHAALLAWVTVTIPESGDGLRGIERPGSTATPTAERVIEVVRIQPPGVLPSGGSGGASAGTSGAAAAPATALPTELPPVSVRGAGSETAGLVALATVPASPLALPALGEPPATAPAKNRGVLRRRPEAGAFPGSDGRWTSGSSGRGFGGGGVTITGVGTDCITAGSGGLGGRTGFGLPRSGRGWGLGGGDTGGRPMGWPGR